MEHTRGSTALRHSILTAWAQENVPAAVEFVEQEVRRLLEGRCELSEMVMTGGLWRITGVLQLPYYPTLHDAPLRHSSRSQQIAQDVLIQRSVSRTGQQLEKAAQGASPEDSAEVRGPHATLAVKLQARSSFSAPGISHMSCD